MSLEKNDKIEWVDINKLKPHAKNSNKHPKDQIERLAKILKYQGFRSPIQVSNLSGCIVAGHGRLEAAKQIGLTKVPVSYQDFESEEQEIAHLNADNAIALWAEIDMTKVEESIKDFDFDFDTDFLGFRDFERKEEKEDGGLTDEDQVPEVKENEYGVKLGDIWKLGEHRVMCGDSTCEETVSKLMNGEKADMVFTDPPYNAGIKEITNDSFKNLEDFLTWTDRWFKQCLNFTKKDSSFYIWSFWKTVCEIKVLFNNYKDLELQDILIWSKPSLKSSSNYYKRSYETCLFYTKGNYVFNKQNADTVRKSTSEKWGKVADAEGWYDPKGNGKKSNINFHTATDIWEDIPTMARGGNKEYIGEHPTQKPLKACERGINCSSNENGLVLDLFLGSGSTLIACEKTNRKCFGMELDPHYVSVIIKRWEDYTGKKAKKISE